jgi:hydroxymethylbilane synthase
LGLQEHMRASIPTDLMCPAVGQGALAVETRKEDEATRRILTFMDDAGTREAVSCERALLGELGGGCQVPIGAFAEKSGKRMKLRAMVGRPDGSEILREWTEGDDPEELGRETAQKLLRRGAQDILNDVYGENAAVPNQP